MEPSVIVHKDGIFHGGRTKLAELLKEMGFSYSKIDDRCYYYEQPHIINERHAYLRRMMKN